MPRATRSSGLGGSYERARSGLAKQRLHDILRSDRDRERDAQLASVATPVEPATAPDDRVRQRRHLHGTREEPVRTRSMARLLASQGQPGRALAIYEALVAIDGTDATLLAELEATRRLVASSGAAPSGD
jgi:hypothetical protein